LVLLAAPARAEDSLFSQKVAAPAVESDAPAAKPVASQTVKLKPKKIVKRKPAPKPGAAAAVQPDALPPVVVQEAAPEPQTGFAQELPKQFLLNRMFSPASVGQAGGSKDSGSGGAAPAREPEEETLPNGMPRKFLLNRLFDSSALEPSREQPDPRSFMAQAQAQPAAQPSQPSWFDQATGALGLSGKAQETQPAANLPPVNVTAPAKPSAPKPSAPSSANAPGQAAAPNPAPVAVAPPSQPSWLDRIPGFGGGNEPIPDYSERPKLAVPPNRDALPPPRPVDERRVQAPPNAAALTRPPPGFTEKVRGPDGKVSGFTEQDEGKKGWFNWF
jgi:hypothetical protein